MPENNKIIIDIDEDQLDLGEQKAKETERFLLFQLSAEFYCVPIQQVKEVVTAPDLTRVPLAPEFVIGIMDLRGEIISVLDVRGFFGLTAVEKQDAVRIIVTDVAGSLAGIITDRIEGTLELTKNQIQPPLATVKEELRRYTIGQAQKNNAIITILDLEKVFRSEAFESLRKANI